MKTLILGLCLRKTQVGKSPHYRHLEKPRFRKNAMPAFLNSSGLKSVFKKLRFRDGLVWTVGLTVEIKLRFQISPA